VSPPAKPGVYLEGINAGILAVREAYLALGYLDVEIKTSLDAPKSKRLADLRVDISEGVLSRLVWRR